MRGHVAYKQHLSNKGQNNQCLLNKVKVVRMEFPVFIISVLYTAKAYPM